jgi:hypothetical protein
MTTSRSASGSSTPKPISADDSVKGVTAGVGELDAARADGYDQLSSLRSAKQNQLTRREKLLSLKYGSDHPRVAEVRNQQSANALLSRDVSIAQVQAATPAPAVDEKGYVFHGYVRNRKREPLPRLTVALYDENGSWFRAMGYGCTDENGYFLLRYNEGKEKPVTPDPNNDPSHADKPDTPPPPPAPAPASKTAFARDEKKAEADTNPKERATDDNTRVFEVRVYDARQQLIYRDPTPLRAQLGQVDYREIIIDENAERCTPPPGSKDTPPPPAPEKPVQPPRRPVNRPSNYRPPAPTKPVSPNPPVPTTSTPLEDIRGVGRKTADKLRRAGIKDIEALEKTDTTELVELAGRDKAVTQHKLRTSAKKKAAKKSPKKKS